MTWTRKDAPLGTSGLAVKSSADPAPKIGEHDNFTGASSFGTGGISSARGFTGPAIVAYNATAALLGSALTGLGLPRRYLER